MRHSITACESPAHEGPVRRIKRLFPAAALGAVLLALGACGTTNQMQTSTDPVLLYNQAMSSYFSNNYEESERGFKKLLDDHPLSPYAVEGELMLGDIAFVAERYEEAAAYYTSFAALHPSHPRAPYAMFQKGMSHFKDVLTIDRDQTATRKAIFAFDDLIASYPNASYVAKAAELRGFLKKRLAESEFYVAEFYYKGKNYKGALARFREILKAYPDSGLTDRALYYIGESYVRLGEETLARDAFRALVADFPDSVYARDAAARLQES